MSRVVAVIFLLLSSACLFAQSDFNECQLMIHVRIEDRDYSGHVQVEILSMAGTPVAILETNADGTVNTTVRSGATYSARITGPDIEPANYQFFIFGGDKAHTENFNIKLKSTPSQVPTAPTISVAEMNVPPKAREEMQKGTEEFHKGHAAKAQQHFEKAVEIYPKYARAYSDLGIIAAQSGDRAKARSMFSKAVEVDDKFLPGYVDLARLDIQDKNYKQAEATLAKVMSLNPSMIEAVAMLATAEYGNKDYDQALANAQRVHMLGNDEKFANMHLMAGQILEMQNRPQDALIEYKMFVKEAPNAPQTKAVQQAIADLERKH
jgi:tetratricopeptide (TPR) repeat protein